MKLNSDGKPITIITLVEIDLQVLLWLRLSHLSLVSWTQTSYWTPLELYVDASHDDARGIINKSQAISAGCECSCDRLVCDATAFEDHCGCRRVFLTSLNVCCLYFKHMSPQIVTNCEIVLLCRGGVNVVSRGSSSSSNVCVIPQSRAGRRSGMVGKPWLTPRALTWAGAVFLSTLVS